MLASLYAGTTTLTSEIDGIARSGPTSFCNLSRVIVEQLFLTICSAALASANPAAASGSRPADDDVVVAARW